MNEIEERKNFDELLGKALRPVYEPSDELNKKILSGQKNSEGRSYKEGLRKWYILPKAAVIAVAIFCVGSAGVYAAVKALKKPVVTDHAISVGNEDYIQDDAISNTEEPVTTNIISSEVGTDENSWISKTVSEVNGYTTIQYIFDSYSAAEAESELGMNVTKEYALDSDGASYSFTEGPDGYSSKNLSASFVYNSGYFTVLQDKTLSNIAEDAAYSIKLENTSNERTYEAASGTEFYLVDEIISEEDHEKTTTYVMLSTDSTNGYISFTQLSEEEIHEVLDTINID